MLAVGQYNFPFGMGGRMKGDIRITLSVRVVGKKETVISMDGTSDALEPLLIVARGCLDQAEAKLKA